MAERLDADRVQVMYQVALLGRRDLPLAPDEYAGFTMALLRMISFAGGASARPAAAPKKATAASAPPPSTTPPPASTQATSEPSKHAFDGDWPALVARLNLTGMAGIVARNSELVSFQNNKLELVVPEAHRVYADRPYTEKLHGELVKVFGAGLRIAVRVGETQGASVAAIRTREDEQRRDAAAQSIEADPFVRELVRDFGAEVVASSIKPADEKGAKP
jgi:DNA polymerase-3 subunit gamma/tau